MSPGASMHRGRKARRIPGGEREPARHSIVFTEAFAYNAPTEVRVRLVVSHGKEHTGRRGKDTMNGAESLVRTLVGGGVNVCFTNPGTSEMHFVAALDKVEGMRCVLALFEGVVTGAADGYWRMLESPAATLLHLGPGLGNGLANLHNAKKAN